MIRWSIDLRWQDANKPSGYHAKPVLPLTKPNEPHYKPQWSEWAQQDRQKLVADKVAADSTQLEQQKDPFDTHIIGSHKHHYRTGAEQLQSPAAESIAAY